MRKFKKKTMALVLLLIVGCIIGVGIRYSILHIKKHDNNNHMAIYVPNENGEGYQFSNYQKIPEGYVLNVEETNAHCSDGLTASWDDATKTVNINATKSGGCNLYLEKEPVKPRCIDSNGDDMTCPQTLETGQCIAIGDEVFRFIRYTSTSSNLNECGGETGISTACGDSTNGDIRALAEYNLYVGRHYTASGTYTDITKESNPSEYGKQNSSAKGWVSSGYPYIGTTPFSSASVKGTNYSSYTGSIVEDYVEEYVQYLSDEYDATVSGGLITKAELESLGCNGTNDYSCSSSTYPWVYTTTYWSGSPDNTGFVWCVYSDGSFSYENYFYGFDFGVRPVITISESYFN